MSGAIKRYKGNVFTNDGQSDVPGFAAKLAAPGVAKALKEVLPKDKHLQVYVGYHGAAGDTTHAQGAFLKKFTDDEMKQVRAMATGFPDALLVECGVEVSDQEIKDAVARGNVFFTWCDSDARVKRVMAGSMPAAVDMATGH